MPVPVLAITSTERSQGSAGLDCRARRRPLLHSTVTKPLGLLCSLLITFGTAACEKEQGPLQIALLIRTMYGYMASVLVCANACSRTCDVVISGANWEQRIRDGAGSAPPRTLWVDVFCEPAQVRNWPHTGCQRCNPDDTGSHGCLRAV